MSVSAQLAMEATTGESGSILSTSVVLYFFIILLISLVFASLGISVGIRTLYINLLLYIFDVSTAGPPLSPSLPPILSCRLSFILLSVW